MEDEERQKKLEAGKAKVGFSVSAVSISHQHRYQGCKVVTLCCRQLNFSCMGLSAVL